VLCYFFQELKKQVETVIEQKNILKSELKKKEKDLKTELENSKVCSALTVHLFIVINFHPLPDIYCYVHKKIRLMGLMLKKSV